MANTNLKEAKAAKNDELVIVHISCACSIILYILNGLISLSRYEFLLIHSVSWKGTYITCEKDCKRCCCCTQVRRQIWRQA